MNLISVIRFIALLSTGLLAGTAGAWDLVCVALLTRLLLYPVSTGCAWALRSVHAHSPDCCGPEQPDVVVLCLCSSVGSLRFVLLALAAAGTICVFALTLAVNVPINKKVMTWSASAPPENLSEIWRPWEQVNTVRTILAVGVFSLEVLALSLAAQGQQIIK